MRIIFLCGSLEPGKDGVGDYTRRLVAELIRQGHQCGIIAIMDKDVQETIKENQDCEHINIPVLRLPFKNGFVLNCQEAKHWLDIFNPEWISLQYVPFSFHHKGLPFGLDVAINNLVNDRKLHIMFHELWVGIHKRASFKLQIWGLVQRVILRSFIKNVSPFSIHTQAKLYQFQLKKIGTNAFLLPLFSNIEVTPCKTRIEDFNKLSFVLFGTIHPGAPVEEFLGGVSKYAFKNNLMVEIIFIGRSGRELQKWIEICQSKKIMIKVLGEQSSQKISEVLSNSDFGITTTPLLTAEKSGTVAAMYEHGLYVLCVCREWEVKGFPTDYTPFGMQLFKEGDLIHYLFMKNENVVINSVAKISTQFLDSLLKFK